MKFTVLDRSAAAELAFGWFNPPRIDDSFSEMDFGSEHARFVAGLATVLSNFGSVAIDPARNEAEFILSNETDLTRSVVVACFSPKVFSRELISAVADYVDANSPERMVVIDGQFSQGMPVYVCIRQGGAIDGWSYDGGKSLSVFGFFD